MKITGKEKSFFPLGTISVEEIDNKNKVHKKAFGGTELMHDNLLKRLNPKDKEKVQIICSRVREIDPVRPTILWLHDTWDDPESRHLADVNKRKRFSKLVFVSNYQFQTYHMAHGITYDESVVIRNAIEPISIKEEKDKKVCRLIYHTTPHRRIRNSSSCVREVI